MANDTLKTTGGKKIYMYRANTANGSLSATQYLPQSVFQIGANQADVAVTDTALTYPLPIDNGTVCDDGSNNFTGSSGGDNSTDNTTTYKDGAGTSDVTAQNLISNGTNASKVWLITGLTANADSTKYVGQWLYIKDQTTLDYFLTSGTCLEFRYESDASNYYSDTYTASELSIGWNWLSPGLISSLTATGTPGTLANYRIIITTNNAADSWSSGDVIYDLLRNWTYAQTIKSLSSGYPSIDLTNLEVESRCYLNTLEANGFLWNGHALANEDTSPIVTDISKIDSESKSNTDETIVLVKSRIL